MNEFININNWVHCLPYIDDYWFCKNLEAELDKWEWITHSNGQMLWKETAVYPISCWYSFMQAKIKIFAALHKKSHRNRFRWL